MKKALIPLGQRLLKIFNVETDAELLSGWQGQVRALII